MDTADDDVMELQIEATEKFDDEEIKEVAVVKDAAKKKSSALSSQEEEIQEVAVVKGTKGPANKKGGSAAPANKTAQASSNSRSAAVAKKGGPFMTKNANPSTKKAVEGSVINLSYFFLRDTMQV